MENYEILLKLKNEHPKFYQLLTNQMYGGACPWAFGLLVSACDGQIRCSECWQQAMERHHTAEGEENGKEKDSNF